MDQQSSTFSYLRARQIGVLVLITAGVLVVLTFAAFRYPTIPTDTKALSGFSKVLSNAHLVLLPVLGVGYLYLALYVRGLGLVTTSHGRLNRDLDATMFVALFSGLTLCLFLASIYPGTVTPEQASTLSTKQVEGMIRSYHIVAFRVLPLIAWVLLLVAFGIFRYRRKQTALKAEQEN